MGIYTAEELKKITGTKEIKPINSVTETIQPEKKGWFTRIREDLIQRGQNIAQGFNTNQNIGSAVLQGVGQVAAGAGDIAGETINSVGDVTGATEALKPVGVAILNTPVGQAGVQAIQGGLKTWEDFKMKEPETAKNIEAVLNIASVLPIGKGAELTGKAVKTGAEMAVETGAKVGAKAKKAVGLAELTPEQRIAKAVEDVTPDYESLTPAKKRKIDASRIQEGGILEGGKLKPTKLQTEAGNELANLPDYNPKSTILEKEKLAKREVKKLAIDLEDALDAEKISVPKREISSRVKKVLDKIPQESLLLQKSDPSIKSYYRVMQNALNQLDGTTKGILDLRKRLDDAYENVRGNKAFASDTVSALDEINTKVRNELTKLLIEKSSQPVKESLRKQWNLYRAMDELTIKRSTESRSKLGRLTQKFPKVTKTLKSVGNLGGGIGIGTGINIAD